jgi:hypothetical protein
MRAGAFNIDANALAWIGAGIAVFMLLRREIAGAAGAVAADIAAGVVETGASLVVGAGTGAVLGVSRAVGIPDTDAAACVAAIEAGEFWRASAYCPAGTFLQNAAGLIFDPNTGEEIGAAAPTGEPVIVEIEPALPGMSPGEGQLSDIYAA